LAGCFAGNRGSGVRRLWAHRIAQPETQCSASIKWRSLAMSRCLWWRRSSSKPSARVRCSSVSPRQMRLPPWWRSWPARFLRQRTGQRYASRVELYARSFETDEDSRLLRDTRHRMNPASPHGVSTHRGEAPRRDRAGRNRRANPRLFQRTDHASISRTPLRLAPLNRRLLLRRRCSDQGTAMSGVTLALCRGW